MSDASLYYFCKHILDLNLLEIEPHWKLCQFLEENIEEDILVLLPRGTFKSSIITVGLTLWELTKDADLRFGISSYKEENVKGWIRQMKSILSTNWKFRDIYGEWDKNRNQDIWHSTAFSIPGRTKNFAQPSVAGTSLTSTEVSQHYDRFIGDDLQTNENASTNDMIQKVEKYIEEIPPMLDPQANMKRGPLRIVGTNWGYQDVYVRLLRRDKELRKSGHPPVFRRYVKRAAKARFTHGEWKFEPPFFFPKRFGEEPLKKLSRSMPPYLFSCNYLNDPQPSGTEVFPLSCLGFFWADETGKGQRVLRGHVSDLPGGRARYTAVDPSIGETDEACNTAVDTVDVDWESNFYVWEVKAFLPRGDSDNIIEEMLETYGRLKPLRIGIESYGWQKTLKVGFNKRALEKGVWVHVESLEDSSKTSKDMRILGLQPFVKAGKVYFRVREKTDLTLPPKELLFFLVEGQDLLAEETMQFPTARTKDCLDALAYIPRFAYPGEKPKEEQRPVHPTQKFFVQLPLRNDRVRKLALRAR